MYKIRWTKWDGGFTSFSDSDPIALENFVRSHGWYSPRWYEFWRWDDTTEKDIKAWSTV